MGSLLKDFFLQVHASDAQRPPLRLMRSVDVQVRRVLSDNNNYHYYNNSNNNNNNSSSSNNKNNSNSKRVSATVMALCCGMWSPNRVGLVDVTGSMLRKFRQRREVLHTGMTWTTLMLCRSSCVLFLCVCVRVCVCVYVFLWVDPHSDRVP